MSQRPKEVEAEILDALERLISLPSSADSDPSLPSSRDIASFEQLVDLFQVSDFEELFVERNCADKCAYVFCPRPPKREPARGAFRMVRSSSTATSYAIVPREQVERWCSPECTKRAMFVQEQLNNRPAWWARTGVRLEPIKILDEQDLEQRLNAMNLDDAKEPSVEQAMQDLTLEPRPE